MKERNYELIHYENWYIRKMDEALNKMYPNIEMGNKYILFILGELWFPYLSNYISADIDFVYKDGSIKNYKSKLRTPYPNKNIRMISMTNGRKVCDLGIPIVFDTYEELNSLKTILIRWEIEASTKTKDVIGKYYVQVLYDVNFKHIEGKKRYVIHSKDSVLETYRDMDMDNEMKNEDNTMTRLNSYLDNFNQVIRIFIDGEDCSYEPIKGEECKEEEIFSNVIQTLGLQKFMEHLLKNQDKDSKEDIIIYNYFSSLIVEPLL